MKVCVTCKEEKETSEFHKKKKSKDGLRDKCKTCAKEYRDIHYENNKQYYLDKAKRNTARCVEWFNEFKRNLKCKNCGENRFWLLDFHHRNSKEKEYTISFLSRRGSRKRILEEVDKCDVLCANCHRDYHYQTGTRGI